MRRERQTTGLRRVQPPSSPRLRLPELAGQPRLLLDPGSSTRAFTEAVLEQAEVTPEIAMELGSIEVIKKMVELGFGLSIVPRVAVEAEVERGVLCALEIFGKAPRRRLGAVYPKRGYLTLAAQEFLKVLEVSLATDRPGLGGLGPTEKGGAR